MTNARRHLRSGVALGDARLYGSGVAHLVLAVEEISKAWLLTMKAMGLPVPRKMLAEVFLKHEPRHAIAIGDLFTRAMAFVAHRAAKRVQARHGVKGYPPQLRDEWAQEMLRDVQALSGKTPKQEPLLAMFEWIGNASASKNRGFYVDFTGSKWISPDQITQKQFELAYAIAEPLVRTRGTLIRRILRRGHVADAEMQERFREAMMDLEGASLEKGLSKSISMLFGE